MSTNRKIYIDPARNKEFSDRMARMRELGLAAGGQIYRPTKAEQDVQEEYLRQVEESDGFDVECFNRIISGAIAPMRLTEQDLEHVTMACQRAIDENPDWSIELVEILKSNHRATAYLEYFITFMARDLKDDAIKTYQLHTAWRLYTDEFKVVLFREKHSEVAAGSSGRNIKGKGKQGKKKISSSHRGCSSHKE